MNNVVSQFFFKIYTRYSSWKIMFKRRYLIYRYPKNVNIHSSFHLGKYAEIDINSSKANLTIHEGVYFRKYCHLFLDKAGRLEIGKNVFFNNYCSINCLGTIEIGENTIIGEGVKLYDHNHKYELVDSKINVARNDFKIGRIKIGKNCWIGSNVTILKDVVIGDNTIIGANCLVFKSIPSNSIVKHHENLIIDTK